MGTALAQVQEADTLLAQAASTPGYAPSSVVHLLLAQAQVCVTLPDFIMRRLCVPASLTRLALPLPAACARVLGGLHVAPNANILCTVRVCLPASCAWHMDTPCKLSV